jgi:hypothetical protein
MVDPWGLEPQTRPTCQPALTNGSAADPSSNQPRRFSAFDFYLSAAGV